MTEHSSDTITLKLKKDTLWKAGFFVVLAVLLIVLFVDFSGSNPTGENVAQGNQAAPTQQGTTRSSVTIGDSPVLGDPDAPITVYEFSDFECPFCARAFDGLVSDLEDSSYMRDGQVKLVYKQFPLNSIHPRAQKAAEASLCAYDQGEFWNYHDTLFANQQALSVTQLKQYAADLGLDTAEFNDCLDSGEKASQVSDELTEGQANGIRGTPGFIVVNEDGDSISVSGAVPFANLESAINQLL